MMCETIITQYDASGKKIRSTNLDGYLPVYDLTAKNQVDGDYGRYFLSRGVMLYQVDSLLRQVAKTQRFESFDEAVAEEIKHFL